MFAFKVDIFNQKISMNVYIKNISNSVLPALPSLFEIIGIPHVFSWFKYCAFQQNKKSQITMTIHGSQWE